MVLCCLFWCQSFGSVSYYVCSCNIHTAIFHGCKNGNFRWKICDIFPLFAQNIDRGYSLEQPHWGGSNEYPRSIFQRKNVYPCKPQFYYIKVECKEVFITRTCYHDWFGLLTGFLLGNRCSLLFVYTASKVKHRLNIFQEKTMKLSKNEFILFTLWKTLKWWQFSAKFDSIIVSANDQAW